MRPTESSPGWAQRWHLWLSHPPSKRPPLSPHLCSAPSIKTRNKTKTIYFCNIIVYLVVFDIRMVQLVSSHLLLLQDGMDGVRMLLQPQQDAQAIPAPSGSFPGS